MIKNFTHREIQADEILNEFRYLTMYNYINAIETLNDKTKGWVTLDNYHLIPLKDNEKAAINHLTRVRGSVPTK